MKVVIFDNIPTKYRDDLYNLIATNHQVSVFYQAATESDRRAYSRNIYFRSTILNSWFVRRFGRGVKHQVGIAVIPLRSILSADLILVTGYNFPTYWLVVALSRFLKKRVRFFWEVTLDEKGVAKKKLLKILSRMAEKVFVPSQSGLDLLRQMKIENAELLRNGVALGSCHGVPFCQRKYDFLFLNRLSSEKGIDRLVSFIRRLDEAGWSGRVGIAGSGEQQAEIESLAGSLERVQLTMLGWVPPLEVNGVLANTKCLLSFSYFEPWGFAVSEALANGCNVISTAETVSAVESKRLVGQVVYITDGTDSVESLLEHALQQKVFEKEWLSLDHQATGLIRE